MKQYYFISGLPRSGSTLLSAILKQNPEFYADVSSPLEPIIRSVTDVISTHESSSNILEDQRKNIFHGIFNGYYQHIEKPIIFDTSRLWTKKTSFLKEVFPYTKIICLVRDIVSILNSFEVIFSKNSLYSIKILDNNQNIFSRCEEMMYQDTGMIATPWQFLQEGYAANPDMIHFIEYNNLCLNPETTMKELYEFIEKPYYSHDFDNLEYSNTNFDKVANLTDLHTIRKRVEYKPPRCILPPDIVEKYSKMNMEFWREICKTDSNISKKFIKYS
jgi:sulfotransferase